MKNFSLAEFLDDLQKIDWKGIVSHTDDVNIIVKQWTSMFSLVLEKPYAVESFRKILSMDNQRVQTYMCIKGQTEKASY